MSDHGLLVFGQSGSPTSKENDYDSRKTRMQTLLVTKPDHLAIIDNFVGGTALVSNASTQQREILARFNHNLPYTPEVFMYFYVKSYGGSTTVGQAGGYQGGAYLYSGSAGTVDDAISLEVDATEVRIVHTLDDLGFGGGYVSTAPNYLLRIKYYVTSNDSHVPSYIGGI